MLFTIPWESLDVPKLKRIDTVTEYIEFVQDISRSSGREQVIRTKPPTSKSKPNTK
jgi:hypothetical protein